MSPLLLGLTVIGALLVNALIAGLAGLLTKGRRRWSWLIAGLVMLAIGSRREMPVETTAAAYLLLLVDLVLCALAAKLPFRAPPTP